MKKVLILAYDFPPYVSVGGLRPYGWYNYFKEFDIEPIVITRQWDNKYGNHLDYIAPGITDEIVIENTDKGTIIRTPYKPNLANKILLKHGETKFKIIRKSISLFYEISQFFFNIGPKKEIYKKANSYLKNQKVDAIIATGEPFILFHYASKLSGKYKTPWIADYRDPWSFGIGMENSAFRFWNRIIEKKTLKEVSFITTVNNTFLKRLKTISNKEIYILPNGYDPSIIEQINSTKRTNKSLTIGFVGSIFEWHPIKSFLKTLELFVIQNGQDSVRLNLYGINNSEYVQLLINDEFIHLKQIVSITPRLPNAEVLSLMSQSDLLLLFNYYAIMGTKIYDYIGLKIPILFCYSNDKEANELRDTYNVMQHYQDMDFNAQQKVIEEKNAGIIVQDSEHLLEVLKNYLQEFKENEEIKSYTQNSEEFSRKHQTGKLADLINKITN